MIIWGSSSSNINTQLPAHGSCLACGHTELALHAIQRYWHLWWIPVFPLNKIFFLTCLKCESTVTNNRAENLVQNANPKLFKTPLWHYIGLVIIVALILFACFFGENSGNWDGRPKNYVTKNLEDPVKANDFLIFYDEQELGYALVRVLKIEGETLHFQVSKLMYKKSSTLNSLVQTSEKVFKDDLYIEDYQEATLEDIRKKFELKNIISRNDNPRLK